MSKIAIIYGIIYVLFLSIFILLYRRVKNKAAYYDEIPHLEKYQNSIFYIGDYQVDFDKRRQHVLSEAAFYVVGYPICLIVQMIFFLALHSFVTESIANCVTYDWTGIYIAGTIAIILSAVYVQLFLLLKNPFITAVCLCQTRTTRSNLLESRLKLCIIFTALLLPAALLATDNYVYTTEDGIYENRYFSLRETEYRYDETDALHLAKRYDTDNNLSDFYCYIKNPDGEEINILNPDLGLETLQAVLGNKKLEHIKLSGDAVVSKDEAERLMQETRNGEKEEMEEWFFYTYLGVR